jgi:hypothetical protein
MIDQLLQYEMRRPRAVVQKVELLGEADSYRFRTMSSKDFEEYQHFQLGEDGRTVTVLIGYRNLPKPGCQVELDLAVTADFVLRRAPDTAEELEDLAKELFSRNLHSHLWDLVSDRALRLGLPSVIVRI